MIEAVNSAIANASLVRGAAEQLSTARAASASSNAQEAPSRPLPQAPFVSPFIFVDVNFDTAVIQIRDSDTGNVVDQFPSQSRLEALQRSEASQGAGSLAQQSQAVQQQSASQAQVQAQAAAQASAVEAQAAAQAFSQAAATSTQGSAGDTTVFA